LRFQRLGQRVEAGLVAVVLGLRLGQRAGQRAGVERLLFRQQLRARRDCSLPCFSRYSILVRSTSAQREDSACAIA
jgi:hypothetical protein